MVNMSSDPRMLTPSELARPSQDNQAFAIHDSIAAHYAAMGVRLRPESDCAVHRLELLRNDVPFESPLFRVNYYSVVLVHGGRGFYRIDGRRHLIQPGTVFMTNPGHIKGYGAHEVVAGIMIAFSEAFLKQYVHENIFDVCPYLIAEETPPGQLESDAFEPLRVIASQMHDEFQGTSSNRQRILGSLLFVLLMRIGERFWSEYDPATESDGDTRIVRDFKQDLESHHRQLISGAASERRRVQDYAAMQCLHPNYFSTVIRRKTGKTVTAWIAEKTLAEAKAQLIRTDDSVQQIATRLGFQDSAHFSRFFKKHAAFSPSQYRRSPCVTLPPPRSRE